MHIFRHVYLPLLFQYIGGYKNSMTPTLCFMLLVGAAIFRATTEYILFVYLCIISK